MTDLADLIKFIKKVDRDNSWDEEDWQRELLQSIPNWRMIVTESKNWDELGKAISQTPGWGLYKNLVKVGGLELAKRWFHLEDNTSEPKPTLGTNGETSNAIKSSSLLPDRSLFVPEQAEQFANNTADVDPRTINNKKSKEKPKPKVPREIGGRRTKSTQTADTVNRDARDRSTFKPRPELICRSSSGSWQWEIMLSAPRECNITEVRQNNTPLSAENGEYRLSNFSGSLFIKYADIEKKESFSLFDDKAPLIFKLQNDWAGSGRKISGITQGHFIVIAPCEWTRTGHVPVESTQCVDTNYLAHYFFKDKDDITNDVGGFEECAIALTQSGFQLSGKYIIDDSDDGRLFVGTPPVLEPKLGLTWARVGEEDKLGWSGENFKPAVKPLGQVMGQRQGRFFLRVYDDEMLIDSGEFRYCKDLDEIQVNGQPYSQDLLLVPSSDGHSLALLRLVGTRDNTIIPALKKNNPHAVVAPDGIVAVAPCQEGDEVTMSLKSENGSVDVVIKLPRIWWRLKRTNNDLNSWSDTPLVMTREEFRELAYANAVIELQLPSHIRNVYAGFENDIDRSIPVAKGLLLADFVDYAEIGSSLNGVAALRVQCDEKTILTLIQVTADLPPTKPDRSPELHLASKEYAAHVKRAGGSWRCGKGFSRGELQEAGLTVTDAARLHIRVDKRRRGVHQTNISTLNEVKNNA